MSEAKQDKDNCDTFIPENVREILTDFTVSYLIEEPNDLVDFAVDFFTRARETRREREAASSSTSSGFEIAEKSSNEYFGLCRKTIFSEGHDFESIFDEEAPMSVCPKTDDQRARFNVTAKNVLALQAFDSEQMQQVRDAVFEKKVTSGDIVTHQGEVGRYFHIIEKGIFQVFISKEPESEAQLVNTLENGACFGEFNLLRDKPSEVSVHALTDGVLWEIERFTYKRILLKASLKKRRMNLKLLDSAPIFNNLSKLERLKLADAFETKTYVKGNTIMKEGEPVEGMYFIKEGTVMITAHEGQAGKKEVKCAEPGEYFGQLSLVSNGVSSTSVYAASDLTMAFLGVETFEKLLGPFMNILMRNKTDWEGELSQLFGSRVDAQFLRHAPKEEKEKPSNS